MKKVQKNNQSGFTLVELAIVLVIIGLIIGGVLVGQDLIRAAEIRSTISQLERYNTASNAFRDKYRYMPGDFPSDQAVNFGFQARAGTVGAGDGNTLLEGGAINLNALDGENVLFWRDLYEAELIEENFTTGTDAPANPVAQIEQFKEFIPEAKMGRGNYIGTFSDGGRNFWFISGISTITAGAYGERDALAPEEAFNIDVKIDDGLPVTGGVRAITDIDPVGGTATADPGNAAAAAGDCIDGVAATDAYNTITEDEARTPACRLRIRMN